MRTALAVIGGYLAAALCLAAASLALWHGLGPPSLFAEGTTLVTPTWLVGGLVAAALAGWLAGEVARRIQPARAAVLSLAVVLVAIGVSMAVAHALVDDASGAEALAGRRVEELSAFEASSEAVAPVWFHGVLAVLQGGGVLLGGRRVL